MNPKPPRGLTLVLLVLGLLPNPAAVVLGDARPAYAQFAFEIVASFALDGSNPRQDVIEGSDGALYGTTQFGGAANSGTVFRLSKDGTGYVILHSFECTNGCVPTAGVTEGSDGALYGTTQGGGTAGGGTVFRIRKDGTGFTVLHSFECGTDGCSPTAGVTEGSDGALYGTTQSGGTASGGNVFRIRKDGTRFTVLHSFECTDGCSPTAGVTEGSDGALYGTTQGGGTAGGGNVFRIRKDGTRFTVLHSFECTSTDGCGPAAGVTEGSDGALYGTTQGGGTASAGTVFKVNRDGTGFTVLHSFDCTNGCVPTAGVTEGGDGALYGTTQGGGGAAGGGTVFRINRDGTEFTVLHSFECTSTDGCFPSSGVTEGSDGALYGTTLEGGTASGGTVFKVNRDGTGFMILHSVDCTNNCGPSSGVTEGSDGALYGTTFKGGTANGGRVFRINRDGTGFTVLHSFECTSTDGCFPIAGVTEGSDGALYGTTFQGGTASGGTVFKVNRDGTGFTVLHSFDCTDGCFPESGVTEGGDGAFYGTTGQGGGTASGGTVFKVNRDGTGFTVLHSFECTDGCSPTAGVTEGSDGALYGTTRQGGGTAGKGTVFRISKDGTVFTVLHSFDCTDGCSLIAGVTEGSDGALYGTTSEGGTAGGGTVFRIRKDGTGFAVLHSFECTMTDGCFTAGVTEGSDGALYGTTSEGGTANAGTVFKVNKDGTGFTVLHSFECTPTNGCGPSGVTEGSDGALYGTTFAGGGGAGTVYRLVPAENTLTALSPARVWIGLRNSDAVGLRVDLRVEVFVNGEKVGGGQFNNALTGSSGFNNAQQLTIPLALIGGPTSPVSTLVVRVSVRRACSGGGPNSGTPRLWYNGPEIDSGRGRNAGSRFGATIGGETDYFLREGLALATGAGASRLFIDKTVNSAVACPERPFTPFGAWSLTLP